MLHWRSPAAGISLVPAERLSRCSSLVMCKTNTEPENFLKRWKLDRAIYDAFIFMDNAYFGFSLPKGTGSERALVF